jgi:hypothetical protein
LKDNRSIEVLPPLKGNLTPCNWISTADAGFNRIETSIESFSAESIANLVLEVDAFKFKDDAFASRKSKPTGLRIRIRSDVAVKTG